MNIHQLLPGLLFAAILSACGSGQGVRNEDSQFFSIPSGSTFTLNREIRIQPDQVSVYLQNGEIQPVGSIDMFRPNCKFELFTISDQARTVEPDTFTVTRILDQREDVSTQWPRYASLTVADGGGGGGDSGPMHQSYSTTLFLESKTQPDVFRMSCRRWDWVNTGEYLSINEMRQALGGYFTLKLADQARTGQTDS